MVLNSVVSKLLPMAAIVVFLAAIPSIGWADTIGFGLEDQALTGATTSITDTQSGLTLSIHRQDNGSFSIVDNQGGIPPAFGTRILANFNGPFTAPGATLILNFSAPLTSGSISFGDFDSDDDGIVTLTAFSGINGTGTNLGNASVPYNLDFGPLGNAAIRTLTVNAAGIQSLTILSGGPFPGSLYFDNIVGVTTTPAAVPEPASMVLLGSGLVALVVSRRFNRRK